MATFNSCATEVKTILAAIAGAPSITIRKTDAIHPRDTLPLCVISLGSDFTDDWGTLGDPAASDYGTTGKRLQIMISYYRACLADIESDLTTVPNFWQAAKRALNKPDLGAVLGAWNVEIQQSEAWEDQPFKEGHEISRMAIIADVSEQRNS